MDSKRRKIENEVLAQTVATVNNFHVRTQRQPSETANLPIELTTADTQLQDLNDDCLREIFRLKTLSLLDLCSLAETCKRFSAIAEYFAPKELSFWMLFGKNEYRILPGKCLDKSCKPDLIKRILNNFGQFLSSVSVDGGSCASKCDLLGWVAEHCKNNLQRLSIHNDHFTPWNTIKVKPLFQQLQQFHLELITMNYDAKLFVGMDSLVDLKVCWVENCHSILENTFPKLQRFSYGKNLVVRESVSMPFKQQNVVTLASFFARHSKLKAVDVRFDCEELCTKIVLKTICAYCKDLEKLIFRCGLVNQTVIQYVQQLKLLRSLSLERVLLENLDVFRQLKELKELKFQYSVLPTDARSFDSLAHITKLFISLEDFASIDLAAVIERVTSLEEIEIQNFILDEETFYNIVKKVTGRPMTLTLRSDHKFQATNVNQKVKLLQINK